MGELGSGLGSSYPTALDTDSLIEYNTGEASSLIEYNTGEASPMTARAEVVNDLADAIVKIETELGTNLKGSYGN